MNFKQIFKEANNSYLVRTVIINYRGRAYIDKYYTGRRRALRWRILRMESLVKKNSV